MGIARIKASQEQIQTVLALPIGMVVLNIVIDETTPDVLTFFVEHLDPSEVPEGASPLEIASKMVVNYDERPGTWITFHWS